MHSQNKVGTHDQVMGQSTYSQRSFLYRAIELYNKLPKNLTLIKSFQVFKKWIKLYHINEKVKLPERSENIEERETFLIDFNIIQACQNYDLT